MKPQVLAVIGASDQQLPAVLKARTLGIETACFAWRKGAVAADYCDRFYPISVLEKEKIVEVCRRENVSGVLTIGSDVSVPTVSYIAETLGLTGNSVESAQRATNKFFMRQALSAAGLKCPRFVEVSNEKIAPRELVDLRYPVIVKPVDRSGSLGVTQVREPALLEVAIRAAIQKSLLHKAIVEEYIDGVEVSVETISWEGQHFHLAITDKETSGSPHFVEVAHHQPSLLPEEVEAELRSQTLLALDALGMRYGASHAEFLVSRGAIYVVEIGARMGGDFIGSELIPLSTGYDFVKGVIEVALGTFQPPEMPLKRYAGIYFCAGERPHVAKIITHSNRYRQVVKAAFTSPDLRPLKKSGDRSGYFIYQDDARFILPREKSP